MAISGLIDIGASALAAQRTAIEITGENIANVNTPGYTRQTAVLETAPIAPDQRPSSGNGVVVSTIQRTYDAFVQKQILAENGSNGALTTTDSALQQIEPLFGDITSDGLGQSLQDFFNSWQDLATNPQGAAERQDVLAKSQSLVDEFHQISGSLDSVKQNANQSLPGLTSDINDKTAQIAQLNLSIRDAEQSGGNANQLLDKRDQVINDLSQKVGISSLVESDGTVSVSLTGGPRLVDGVQASVLSVQTNPADPASSGIVLTHPGDTAGTDITSLLEKTDQGGELGGTLQVRDVVLSGFSANLDELAYSLAVQVNNLHAAGFGLNGSSGVNFFAPPPAPVPPATFASGFSSAIALNITDGDQIAAASADPTQAGGGTGNNVTALQIADLKDLSLPMSDGSSTLSDFYGALTGKVGLSVQSSQQAVTTSGNSLQQLDNLRESISGVSQDEELTNLISSQKAFEGAAKLITAGQQMMDTILNLVT